MQIGSISSSWSTGPSQAMKDRFFKRADSNGDGSISLDEFKALGSNKSGRPNPLSPADGETTESIFAGMDTNGDGQLSADELDTGMQQRMQAFQDQLRTALFKQADTNGDGVLSPDEFAAIQQVSGRGGHRHHHPDNDGDGDDVTGAATGTSTAGSTAGSTASTGSLAGLTAGQTSALKTLFQTFESALAAYQAQSQAIDPNATTTSSMFSVAA